MAELNAYLTALLQQSPMLGVAVMMNNYFHDVATAMLAASAFCLYAAHRVQESLNTPDAALFFLKTHRVMVRFFRFAFWWIILGGVPRTVFYASFEWNHFADKQQVPALMVKHVLMAVLVVWGVVAWRRLKAKVALLSQSLAPELRVKLDAEK
uniref:Uncharacterized protein n=1 Tax=Geobacter sp. (strain M21) TaxID=443144 RepID=C6E623_GEOSM